MPNHCQKAKQGCHSRKATQQGSSCLRRADNTSSCVTLTPPPATQAGRRVVYTHRENQNHTSQPSLKFGVGGGSFYYLGLVVITAHVLLTFLVSETAESDFLKLIL